jgi:hypothetical protein
MNKFDKLVNSLLRESDEYGFDEDQIGVPENTILKGLEVVKKSIKKNQIVDKALYKRAVDLFYKATVTGEITDINYYDDTTSPFYEAIFRNVTSYESLAIHIFRDITAAFMKGEKDRLPQFETEEDDDNY